MNKKIPWIPGFLICYIQDAFDKTFQVPKYYSTIDNRFLNIFTDDFLVDSTIQLWDVVTFHICFCVAYIIC